MKLFTRTPVDLDHARLVAQFEREQRAAAEQERQQQQAKREAAKVARRDRRRAAWGKVRTVLPLLLINGGAAYSQALFAYYSIAPSEWNALSKLAFALAFAVALESISVYVQWHAHDAAMNKGHARAAKLRRAAWLIAMVIGGINYAHWAAAMFAPTAAAVAFGLLSLLSPWLWGLHTDRAQHKQKMEEDPEALDDAGVEFSAERRRAFPIRSYMAKRWSIDYGVRNPQAAWEGYRAERQARRAQHPAGRFRAAWSCLRGKPLPTVAATTPVAVAATSRSPRQPVERTSTAKVAASKPTAVAAKKQSPIAAKVARFLVEQPDATAPVIAAKIKASERTVSHHLKLIREAAAAERVNGSAVTA